MDGLPVTLVVAGRRCIVVGGGAVAARKVDALRRAHAAVTVVAPDLTPALEDLARSGAIVHRAKSFAPRDLAGAVLVIAATSDRGANAAVSAAAQRRGMPVNVVDDPALCTVTMPAIVERGPVSVAIATGGAAPTLARHLRGRIERALPAGTGALADFMRRMRPVVASAVADAAARRRLWDRVVDGPIADLAMAGRTDDAERCLRDEIARAAAASARGKVFLVGAGPGDGDLLTIKAARLLGEADIVVHDRLVGDDVFRYVRRDAERIDVGKRCGGASARQADINALLVRLALAGRTVIRLKGGDPFVFGRGGEEMQALIEAGIACEIVPGITAALGCAAYAGIPLTHRDHAHGCVLVTGHRRGGTLDLDWASLARPLQTVCVYMGMASIGLLVEGLLRHGLSPRTPAAIVVDGTTARQQARCGRLGGLAQLGRGLAPGRPALVIVGEVVALRRADRATAEASAQSGGAG